MAMLNENAYKRLRGKLVIDQLRIDEELSQVPILVMEAVENTAEAMHVRDNCKNRLDAISANVSTRLRNMALSENGKERRRTEGAVSEETLLDDDVQNALGDLEVAKYDFALWNGLLEALRDKGSSCRRIGEMMVSGILTSAQVGQDRRQELREASKTVNAQIASRRRE
jgi:hypothetical protein